MTRLLGIDHGDKRIGLALSDELQRIATPHGVAHGEAELGREIERLIRDESLVGLVVGLPLNMDGSAGPKARQVLEFVERLKQRFDLPVETIDERLTSVQAESMLRDMGVPPKKRAARIDQVAAQIILQDFLDAQARRRQGGDGPTDASGLADCP